MTRIRLGVLAMLLGILFCGCGGNRDKDINKGRDRPQGTQAK